MDAKHKFASGELPRPLTRSSSPIQPRKTLSLNSLPRQLSFHNGFRLRQDFFEREVG